VLAAGLDALDVAGVPVAGSDSTTHFNRTICRNFGKRVAAFNLPNRMQGKAAAAIFARLIAIKIGNGLSLVNVHLYTPLDGGEHF
jgi:hypothetical protein